MRFRYGHFHLEAQTRPCLIGAATHPAHAQGHLWACSNAARRLPNTRMVGVVVHRGVGFGRREGKHQPSASIAFIFLEALPYLAGQHVVLEMRIAQMHNRKALFGRFGQGLVERFYRLALVKLQHIERGIEPRMPQRVSRQRRIIPLGTQAGKGKKYKYNR